MPWLDEELDQELVANAGLGDDESLDLALLEGGDIQLPHGADVAAEADETRVPTEADFGVDPVAAAATPAGAMIVLSLVDDDGVQGAANVDRALWARAEPVIRAMASRKGYTITLGGSPGRNARTMNEVSAFISDTSQTTG